MYVSFSKTLVVSCLFAHFSVAASMPVPLTEAEASAIVESQEMAKQAAEVERRARLLAIASDSGEIIRRGGKQTLLRRVEPRYLEVAQPEYAAIEESEAAVFTESLTDHLTDHQQETISIGATVFDDSYTQIIWRESGVQGGEPITVWMNVNFKYLRPVSSWEDGGVHYSYFGFTSEVDTEAQFVHPETGEKVVHVRIPDWMPEAADFPDDAASYLVLVEDADIEIPDQLYRQMDALLRYFVENEPELLVQHQRSEALRKAKIDYMEKNPPTEKDIVINFWPIQSNTDF